MHSKNAIFIAILGIYTTQSILGGITWTGLPGILRAEGLPLDKIGLISLIALPWALKFLWSPLIEQYRLPQYGKNRSAKIVIIGLVFVISFLLIVGFIGPGQFLLVCGLLMICAIATATIDIAIDGYTVEVLSKKEYGLGNTAQVGGAYLGAAIGGGLFIYLVGVANWGTAIFIMVGLIIIICSPFIVITRQLPDITRNHTPSLIAALKTKNIQKGLLLAFLYVISQKTAMGFFSTFFIDSGYAVKQLGILAGTAGLIMSLISALISGFLINRFGTKGVLLLAVVLQTLLLFCVALSTKSIVFSTQQMAPIALIGSSAIMAFGFVALYSQFMSWSNPQQGGIDFTLFQCMDATTSMTFGVVAGIIAEQFGYTFFFSLCSFISLLMLPLIYVVNKKYSKF